jgi:uncharacterized protein
LRRRIAGRREGKHMGIWLSRKELSEAGWAADLEAAGPVPTRVVSNGEYTPPPQTADQRRVEACLQEIAERESRRLGLGRRRFLQMGMGMVASLIAMNRVYGSYFAAADADMDPDAARAWEARFARQFVFDDQVHFVSDHFRYDKLLDLRRNGRKWNPELEGETVDFDKVRFENFVKEVYLDSETSVALLSGAPSDASHNWFLENSEIAAARRRVNDLCGSRRLLCHAVLAPGQPNWIAELDRLIEEMKPDGWKGYTIGDPLAKSHYPYRLDDEKLMYPAYEKFKKCGIRNVCIHKGLIPRDYAASLENLWHYATVDDLPKAARDWPDLNFVIYHAALKPGNGDFPADHLAALEKTGRMDWVSDLAAIPKIHGVKNVYADVGSSFASCAVTHPAHAAALIAILVDGLGQDHVLWGTDSVWYGSPQWQIEAFRRLELPEPLRERLGVSPLGPGDGPLKTAILGQNGARLFGLEGPAATVEHYAQDRLADFRARYAAAGADRSNLAYGFIRK